MRGFFRNLLAAFRGRRAQGNIASVVKSFDAAAEQLDTAHAHLVDEQLTLDEQARKLLARSNQIVVEAQRAKRLSAKLRDFTS